MGAGNAPLREIPLARPGRSAAVPTAAPAKGLEAEARKTADDLVPATSARVSFVYFDAGGGHRSAARALVSATLEQRLPWEIDCLNLQELLDPLDLAKKLLGIRVQDVYNSMLEKGWTLGAAQLLPLLHAVIRSRHSMIVKFLERYWQRVQPDLVVSLIPNFNRELAESVRLALPGAPFATVMTDLADYPPHFWIERESDYLIVGTGHAEQQALALGHSRDHVFRTSGMVLNPAFYSIPQEDCRLQRETLGFDPQRRTGLVMFGGQGSRAMLQIARRLNRLDGLQLILIAGRNAKLERELRRMEFRIPTHIEGFTAQIPRYMQMSDFFIGKPGPGSLSEALFMGLPVIVERNAWTLPQERFNTDWITGKELGLVVRSFRNVDQAAEGLLDSAVLAHYRQNTRQIRNRAVYEVVTILESILAKRKGEIRPRDERG